VSTLDLTFLDQSIERIGKETRFVLPLLQAIQNHYGYLPTEALERLCKISECTPSEVWSVATFYDQFRLRPAGKHFVRVCIGTACHVKGANRIYEAFRDYLKIREDDDTDAERKFTVEKVACLGCCMLAPAVQIDDVIYGHLRPETVGEILDDFLAQQDDKKSESEAKAGEIPHHGQVRLCLDSSCRAVGSDKVFAAMKQAVKRLHLPVRVKGTGCHGMSYLAPLVEVLTEDGRTFRYGRVQPGDAEALLRKHFRPASLPARIEAWTTDMLDSLVDDRLGEGPVRYNLHIRPHETDRYLGPQVHIATEHFGHADPLDIEEYKAHGGYESLKRCLADNNPEKTIETIERAGLRGRGGGGFPTHLKWFAVRKSESDKKYIILNGDEGDPGAFMDRMLMESYPFRILEGMAIAAATVGADEGYLYIRAEYPLALERIRKAMAVCREHGYLGSNICGSGFSLELHLYAGAGAFVCGEETALLASIEGRRGMPHLRPPYPTRRGLWQKPTLVNNVETYALVPWILRNGPKTFAAHGTEHSKGTKVFALAGKVQRGGLVEVPMGITIRQIVEEIGGGIEHGRSLKAVQIGGPSGGCVPASMADTPIDYESLVHAGAIMGSGGMVVLDENDCMVDIARYFLAFTQDQSCGKCTFCRIGTKRMLELLDTLCTGKGKQGDIEKLIELGHHIQRTSLCGLGKTAPNPVLSTIEHFRDEYEAHLAGRCPACTCRALIRFTITDKCIGCTRCAQRCPADAIAMKPYQKHEIDQDKCVRCGTCKSVCPAEAVHVE
jgi:NADH-quinone oxidoreductase subunit F